MSEHAHYLSVDEVADDKPYLGALAPKLVSFGVVTGLLGVAGGAALTLAGADGAQRFWLCYLAGWPSS